MQRSRAQRRPYCLRRAYGGWVAGSHFERMAAEYAGARPPYPAGLFAALALAAVTGPGRRVLEIGAGTGLATRELVSAGCNVVAIEPGPHLAALLRRAVPAAEVVGTTLEGAHLAPQSFDSAVAATSMHWVDLGVGLPKLHAALRSEGRLAMWRNIFGDETVDTEFRERVHRIVRARGRADAPARGDEPPTMQELAAGGWFVPVETLRWSWSIELTTEQVRRLFSTFSDWRPDEVAAAAEAVDDLGGAITEHYRSVLHLLHRA